MNARVVFGILLFITIFGGFQFLLTRSALRPAPHPEEKAEVLREMARFVEKHPVLNEVNKNIISPNPPPPVNRDQYGDVPAPRAGGGTLLGVRFEASERERLRTDVGRIAVQQQILKNPAWATQELKQAWATMEPGDWERREFLQELTVIYRGVHSDPDLDQALVHEMKRLDLGPRPSDQQLEYVGRTLQRHLDSERDEGRLTEQLLSLGIPRVVIGAPPETETLHRRPASAQP